MESTIAKISVPDGTFDMQIWLPQAGHGPAILLVQEIYGVAEYIRLVAADLAGMGYVVGAPDMFWRIQPGFTAGGGEEGLQAAIGVSGQFVMETGLQDAAAAYHGLVGRPEAQGGAGLLGFCFGGTVAYLLAPSVEPDAVICFYGSGIPGSLEVLDQITCPVLFVFGGSDPYISRTSVAEVEQAVAGHPGAEILVEEAAGHAFHNRTNPMFSQPEPAARAWRAAEEFLARHLPVD
jgi:carboxymethylenebutenolidase